MDGAAVAAVEAQREARFQAWAHPPDDANIVVRRAVLPAHLVMRSLRSIDYIGRTLAQVIKTLNRRRFLDFPREIALMKCLYQGFKYENEKVLNKKVTLMVDLSGDSLALDERNVLRYTGALVATLRNDARAPVEVFITDETLEQEDRPFDRDTIFPEKASYYERIGKFFFCLRISVPVDASGELIGLKDVWPRGSFLAIECVCTDGYSISAVRPLTRSTGNAVAIEILQMKLAKTREELRNAEARIAVLTALTTGAAAGAVVGEGA